MKNIVQLFSLLIVAMAWGQSVKTSSYMSQNDLVQPPFLKPGDTVAIVAPSGILKNKEGEVNRAKALLLSWGLHVTLGANIFKQNNHFAGTDKQRASDLQEALNDKSVSAIWCARGGYGTVRILDLLDFTEFKKHPKWLIGYSDITALHNAINNQGVQSMHALMCVSLTEKLGDIKETITSFKASLFGDVPSYRLEGSDYNKIGEASGQLVGGNLTILHTMLGSNTSIYTDGKILFIEEIGEYKYHIDRMLHSLKRAGYFDNCAGLIVGDMSKIRKNTTAWGTSIEQLILDALSEYNFPIAFNMPAGHESDNRALILGRSVELTVGKQRTSIIAH